MGLLGKNFYTEDLWFAGLFQVLAKLSINAQYGCIIYVHVAMYVAMYVHSTYISMHAYSIIITLPAT